LDCFTKILNFFKEINGVAGKMGLILSETAIIDDVLL
jgi:hypothetical protein